MSKDMTKLKDELWIMQKDQKVISRNPSYFSSHWGRSCRNQPKRKKCFRNGTMALFNLTNPTISLFGVLFTCDQPLPEPSPVYSKFTTNGQASSPSSAMLSASQSAHGASTGLPPQSPIHATHAGNSSRSPIYSTDSGFHSVPSSPHSPGDIRGRGGSSVDTHEV